MIVKNLQVCLAFFNSSNYAYQYKKYNLNFVSSFFIPSNAVVHNGFDEVAMKSDQSLLYFLTGGSTEQQYKHLTSSGFALCI